jgi:GDP-fucose transporter C1
MGPALGCAGAFTGMLATGNLCLMFVQVSFYQVSIFIIHSLLPRQCAASLVSCLTEQPAHPTQAAKSQHILFSLLLSAALGETAAPVIMLSCAGVTVGFIINAMAEVDIIKSLLHEEISSLVWGMIAGLVSSFFVALYPLLLKRSMLTGLDNWQISINVNLMSFIWFLPLIGYEIVHGGMLNNPVLYDTKFWAFNFATASVGFVLNLASMLQVRLTSPLTHMVVGAFKGAVTTCLGVLMFGNMMNFTSAIGVGILILSSFAYSYLKYQHSTSEIKSEDTKKHH